MARSSGSGGLPTDLQGEVLEEARGRFFEDFYAPSTKESVAAKWRTVTKMLELQGMSPFPPTVARIHALGVALKYGKYKSAASYFSQYRVECERRGFHVNGPSVTPLVHASGGLEAQFGRCRSRSRG